MTSPLHLVIGNYAIFDSYARTQRKVMKCCKHSEWLISTKKTLCGLIWTFVNTRIYWNVGDYICTFMDTNYKIGQCYGELMEYITTNGR
jgi:hypothetical protein